MSTAILYTAPYTLREEPVKIPIDPAGLPADLTALCCGERVFPATCVADGVLAILSASAGETLALIPSAVPVVGCTATPTEQGMLLSVDGHRMADYICTPDFPKPHLGPITDNAGNPFTRCERMHPEHPHQRSLIIAIGDVNGVDCWNEQPHTCGYVRHEAMEQIVSSAAYASFTAVNRWTDHDGAPLLRERTTFTVYNQSEICRTLDVSITFTADCGDVVFGATKEAGPLGIRLRDELRADMGSGELRNALGSAGEEACWGKEAAFCDYAGDVSDVGPMGVTILDSPANERYPTAWHIRAYGLFAANNLYFKGGYTLPNGESITYRYRILFRRASMSLEELEERCALYHTLP